MSERLGNLAAIHYGKSPSEVLDEDGQYPVVGTGGVYAKAKLPLFSSAIVVPRKGSLGKPWLVRGPVWPVDTTYAVVPNAGVNIDWLFFNLLNFDLTKLNEATGVPSISRNWLKKIKFAKQDETIQKKIASILLTIDEAIEQIEALIEKYSQIRAGMMQDLFTRGLFPDGKLRPTRSETPELYQETPIGWIPRDWEYGLLNEIANPARPIVYGILMPGYGHDGGIPVVKVKDIKNGKIDLENLLLTSPIIDQEYRRSRLKPLDILLTIRGTFGRICIVPDALEGANITQDTARIDVIDGDKIFFRFYLESDAARKHFSINTLGVAVQGINLSEVRKTPIVKPGLGEQKQISARISAIVDMIESEQVRLTKLKLQRSGLVGDLLTGRVAVKVGDSEPEHV